MMKYAFLLISTFCLSLAADEKLSSDQFLARVRKLSASQKSWGRFEGTVNHRRRGEKPVSYPIQFSVMFTKNGTVARIVFRKDKVYNISQQNTPPYESTVESPKNGGLADVGLRPEDLTMGFLFAPLAKEYPETSVRGQTCRVFLFVPEKKKELIKVYISRNYYFPLRVEWFPVTAKEKDKPFRTLEADSFGQENELWVIKALSIFGPGWRTSVEFKDIRAGMNDKGIPGDLF